jgi:putative ABC transport system permease protein
MHTLFQDIRYAWRQLRHNPGFALTAVLSLALGIGATVSVFSIIYSVLINPFPYAGASRISWIYLVDKAGHDEGFGLSGPQIQQIAKTDAFEYVMGFQEWNLTVTGNDVPEDVQALYMTGNGFQFLGVPAMLGRYFLPGDAPDGKDPLPVVVLNYKFWQRHYNSDPAVVGKTIHLVRKPYTVIGVMPPHFGWLGANVYLPLKLSANSPAGYGISVKLKPGVAPAAAASALQTLYQQFAKEAPNHFPKQQFKVDVRGTLDGFPREFRHILYLLFGAVSLILLIGCGNVSILLLARGTARQHEFAVRTAVGASSFRIVRQLLTESVILAFTGAGLGVILAYSSVGLIVARLPEDSFPNEADFHVHVPVLLFSIGIAIFTGVFFGLFPALRLRKPEVSQVMQASTRRIAGSVPGKLMHNTLIVGQIAVTLLLLTAAGTAIERFMHLMRIPLGYDPHNVMSVGIPVHDNTLTTWTERANYFAQLRERIAQLPDVVSIGISTNATPPNNGWSQAFELLGKTAGEEQKASTNFVDPGYFSTLQIPLRQGRLWDATEVAHAAPLAVVNETFAKHYYPGGDVLGHSVKIPTLKSEPPYTLDAPGSDGWLQIVGVVSDVLDDGFDKPVKPAIFLPYSLNMWMWTQILVRSRVDPRSIQHSVKQRIVSVNPDQQATLWNDGVLESWIMNQPEWARGRLVSILFSAFSILALFLAAVGLYSVVSYSVIQRTNEFGIRMALGAQKTHVLRIVLASAGASVGLGIVLGFALCIGFNRLIARWVENNSHNPFLILAASFVLLAVATVACLVPARRASSVDPMTALRCE